MSVYGKLQNEILTCVPTLKGSKQIRQASNPYIPDAYISTSPNLRNAWLSFKAHKRINISRKIRVSVLQI